MQSEMPTKRKQCWEDTKKRCEKITNHVPSIKINYEPDFLKNNVKKYHRSEIHIYDMDTIDCSLLFKNPLILNLADNYFPGGYVDEGCAAQEESLFRRTTYCKTLIKSLYPIENNEAIYSPNVSLLKMNEENDWKLYPDDKIKLQLIACPGIKYPSANNERLNERDVQLLKVKIRLIVQCAVKYKHDIIVFGALGCGAWKNPPLHVAEIFKEVLLEYDGIISTFVFAILGRKVLKDKMVLDAFREILL